MLYFLINTEKMTTEKNSFWISLAHLIRSRTDIGTLLLWEI